MATRPRACETMMTTLSADRPAQPTFAELFTPKLVTVLREGYGWKDVQADAVSGLTVAIVALPLSMAIAIASGVSPERGLYTAIVGGFLISLLGGSRVQIGGPAGAFIILVAAIVAREGYDGLALATLIAGAILVAAGFLQLGTFIKYIPYPVTVGFTAGIAVIIVVSQIHDLLGLQLAHEPTELVPKLQALWRAIPTLSVPTVGIALLSLAAILIVHRIRPRWPAFLIAVVLASAVTAVLHFDVATVGSRFGGVPDTLPRPHLPPFSLEKLPTALWNGAAIAFLGAIESLLSAVVADGMTGRRHRSNCELVAQGVANMMSATFGGISVTGTIARTATNVRAGARGPVSGIFHAGYLLLFILVASSLIAYIPLAALGAVLLIVAWNMAEKAEFAALLRSSRGDALVVLATFLLSILVDLMTGIGVGVVLGAFLFLHRMAEAVHVDSVSDQPDTKDAGVYGTAAAEHPDVMVYRISGAFFFGATAAVGGVLDRIGTHPKIFVLDFRDVPFIDTTAARMLQTFVRKLERAGTQVYLASAPAVVRRMLLNAGLESPRVTYAETVDAALESAKGTAVGAKP
jgi:sulfate permease, SulP family